MDITMVTWDVFPPHIQQLIIYYTVSAMINVRKHFSNSNILIDQFTRRVVEKLNDIKFNELVLLYNAIAVQQQEEIVQKSLVHYCTIHYWEF